MLSSQSTRDPKNPQARGYLTLFTRYCVQLCAHVHENSACSCQSRQDLRMQAKPFSAFGL